MNVIDLTLRKFANDRTLIRKEIINLFLDETPGTGKDELTSRYKYVVKIVGVHEIYLKRPAQFNNGFDFTLNVSNINFNPEGKATSRPTHQNILNDLEEKKDSDLKLYKDLKLEIDRIYNCEETKNLKYNFNVGLDSEVLLECIKWLFIEQDVTYWNYSGRSMFYNGINTI